MKKLFSFAILLLLLQSCATYQPIGYRATTPQIAELADQGDISGMATFGLNHVEAQAAISPIKHVGIIGNTYQGSDFYTRELGLGTYYAFNEKFLIELYGSFGKSRLNQVRFDTTENNFSPFTVYSEDRMNHAYTISALQLNGTYRLRNFSASMGAKYTIADYTSLDYYSKRTNFYSYNQETKEEFYQDELNNKQFLALTARITYGWPHWRVFAQYTGNIHLTGSNDGLNDAPYFRRHLISSGIIFQYGLKKKPSID